MSEIRSISVTKKADKIFEELKKHDKAGIGFSGMLAMAANEFVIKGMCNVPKATDPLPIWQEWMYELPKDELKEWLTNLESLLFLGKLMMEKIDS